jgi:hypothetical protein
MDDDTETLFELMLAADRLCIELQNAARAVTARPDRTELLLKIAQCRTMIRRAREYYDKDQLTIDAAAVRGTFRNLIMAALWMAFYARGVITRKMFRKLVVIESGFTYLLVQRA